MKHNTKNMFVVVDDDVDNVVDDAVDNGVDVDNGDVDFFLLCLGLCTFC